MELVEFSDVGDTASSTRSQLNNSQCQRANRLIEQWQVDNCTLTPIGQHDMGLTEVLHVYKGIFRVQEYGIEIQTCKL